jgi:hypothetical protein
MAVIKLYSDNPKDGTTTFDKVRFYEANDINGTGATLIATVDIDTSNVNVVDSGFTSRVYNGGSTSKFYASSWYNSGNGIETDKSDYVQGGQDRMDTRFMNELQDTPSAVWTSGDRQRFKEAVLEALYPDFFYDTIDTSLSITNNSTNRYFQYTLPFGIFNISEVGIGKLNDQANQPFKIVLSDYWVIDQNKLIFRTLDGLANGYQIRLVCSKKYLEIGEVPTRLDPLMMYHLRMNAYLKLADDYPRFLTWARLQKGTKVTFESLRVHAKNFENMFNTEKEKMKDLLRSSLA